MTGKAPDYNGAIAGARTWRVAPTLWAKMGGILWAKVQTDVWPNSQMKIAECERGHPVPDEHCSCGVYAWCNEKVLHEMLFAPTDHTHISGVIAGAGGVIRGHNGYWVAEKVIVLAFFDDGHPSPKREVMPGSGVYLATKEEAAQVWGVPVIKYEEYEDFCDEYGLWRCDENGEFL